jgi:hypothetical protein
MTLTATFNDDLNLAVVAQTTRLARVYGKSSQEMVDLLIPVDQQYILDRVAPFVIIRFSYPEMGGEHYITHVFRLRRPPLNDALHAIRNFTRMDVRVINEYVPRPIYNHHGWHTFNTSSSMSYFPLNRIRSASRVTMWVHPLEESGCHVVQEEFSRALMIHGLCYNCNISQVLRGARTQIASARMMEMMRASEMSLTATFNDNPSFAAVAQTTRLARVYENSCQDMAFSADANCLCEDDGPRGTVNASSFGAERGGGEGYSSRTSLRTRLS